MNVDRILEVGLQDHCVFCLRKTGKKVPLSQVRLLDGFLDHLNEVWECLRSQYIKKGSVDVELGQEITLKHVINTESSEVFHSIPNICQGCAGAVQAVGELLKALRTHLKRLLQVILESRPGGKYSRRSQQFGTNLRKCCVEETVLVSTLELLNSICSREIQATVKPEPMDHDDDAPSDYNEELANFDGEDESSDQDPDYIVENGEEQVTDGKEEVYMDISDPDPVVEDSSSPSVRTRRKKGTGRLCSSKLKYPCPVNACDKAFQKKSRLNSHLRSCHPETIPPEVPKFPCTCGKTFFLKKDRDLHIKSDLEAHPKPEVQPKQLQMYTCDMCGNRISKKARLEHIISHVGEEYLVKCPNEKCSFMTTNSTALLGHTKRYQDCKKAAKEKNVGITCETCGSVEEGRMKFIGHLRSVHERSAEKKHKCPVTGCEMSFCVRQSVDLHLSVHKLRETTTQTCKHCSENYKVEEMEDHLKSSHQAVNVFSCLQCPFQFSSRLVLLEHMWEHRHLGISCDICNDGVKYPRFSEFRQHYFSAHQIGEKKWSCDQCGMGYFSKMSLNSHITKKHGQSVDQPKEKKYPCKMCSYDVRFASRPGLETHEINVHGKEGFTCDTCSQTFKNRPALNNHKREHAGIKLQKEWACEVEGCGKVFGKRKSWKLHKDVYHGERVFVCDICGKGYPEENMMRRHHDSVHLGLRPCVCEECGEGFVTPAVLKRHKMIHSGERPFACEMCGQRFRQKEVLKRHLEAHEKKGDRFKKKGPMKQIRKRTNVQQAD